MKIMKKILFCLLMLGFIQFSFAQNDSSNESFDDNKISSFIIGIFLAFGFFIYLFYEIVWENFKKSTKIDRKRKKKRK